MALNREDIVSVHSRKVSMDDYAVCKGSTSTYPLSSDGLGMPVQHRIRENAGWAW